MILIFPPFVDVKKELENCSTFFMTLGLYGLLQEYVATRDMILGSVVNPIVTSRTSTLLFAPQNKHGDTYFVCMGKQ